MMVVLDTSASVTFGSGVKFHQQLDYAVSIYNNLTDVTREGSGTRFSLALFDTSANFRVPPGFEFGASVFSFLTDAVESICSFSNLPNANTDDGQTAGRASDQRSVLRSRHESDRGFARWLHKVGHGEYGHPGKCAALSRAARAHTDVSFWYTQMSLFGTHACLFFTHTCLFLVQMHVCFWYIQMVLFGSKFCRLTTPQLTHSIHTVLAIDYRPSEK